MDEQKSVETEDRKQEDEQITSVMREPTSDPDVMRVVTPVMPAEEMVEFPSAASIPQVSSELSFACILVPRFSDDYLTGDIVNYLTEWMKQVCISYGWRLTMLSIRPGYMQWVMQVPLNANPARFMRLIRQYTSEKIFEDFPRFKNRNVSGEFWAPGNFVAPGNELQTPEQVNELILQTRRYQGLA